MKLSTSATRAASRRTGRLVALGGVLAVLLGVAAILGVQRAAPSMAVAGQSDFAGLVDIGGGRRLYLECRGTGSPAVVLEAGYRRHGGYWSIDYLQPDAPRMMVLPAVARFTRVCAYDRPGTVFDPDDPAARERGDLVPQPRAAEDTAADLHALLRAAAVPGPYVLAAHSLGGLYARLYTAAYPDEVAGLVLVDALSEGIQARLTPAQMSAYVVLLLQPPPGFETINGMETVDVGAGFAQMRAAAATPPRPMPLAVLSKGQPFELPPDLPAGFSGEALEQAWQAAQGDLPRLVPSARLFVVTDSGHEISQDQPAPVIEAIRQVVAGVRDPDTWYNLVACCTP